MPPVRYGVNGRFVGDAYMRPVERFGNREVPRSGQDRSLQSTRGRVRRRSGEIGGGTFVAAPVGSGVPDAPQTKSLMQKASGDKSDF